MIYHNKNYLFLLLLFFQNPPKIYGESNEGIKLLVPENKKVDSINHQNKVMQK